MYFGLKTEPIQPLYGQLKILKNDQGQASLAIQSKEGQMSPFLDIFKIGRVEVDPTYFNGKSRKSLAEHYFPQMREVESLLKKLTKWWRSFFIR